MESLLTSHIYSSGATGGNRVFDRALAGLQLLDLRLLQAAIQEALLGGRRLFGFGSAPPALRPFRVWVCPSGAARHLPMNGGEIFSYWSATVWIFSLKASRSCNRSDAGLAR